MVHALRLTVNPAAQLLGEPIPATRAGVNIRYSH